MSRTTLIGPALSPALTRCLAPSLAWLAGAGRAGGPPGIVVLGAPEPQAWATASSRRREPLVVVPAAGPGPPSPLLLAAVAAADVLVLLPGDGAVVGPAPGVRVVRAALPAPSAGDAATGVVVDPTSPVSRRCALLWRRVTGGEPPPAGPAVRWLAGHGSAAAADALCAAADGACPVALPGCRPRGVPVPMAETPLEVLEVTALLRGAGPLHDAIRTRVLAAAAAPLGPALAVLEALVAAAATAPVRPRRPGRSAPGVPGASSPRSA